MNLIHQLQQELQNQRLEIQTLRSDVQRLTTVRQRDDECLIAYLARFERFIFEADASTWPDVTLVTTLHRGLRPALRQSLDESHDSLFSLSYDAYIEFLQSKGRRSRHSHSHLKKNTSDPMQLNAVEINTLDIDSPSTASSQSSISRHEQRLEQELCFYCGSSEHWIADCRQRAPSSSSSVSSRPSRTKLTAKRTAMPVRLAQGDSL
jgi:hypothetical protein